MLSLLDGISFLVLLYFSIYEKRMLGNEDAIRVPGMVHGVIFLGLCAGLGWWVWKRGLAVKLAGLVFLGAFVPFAPFFIDGLLRKRGGL